MNNNQVTVKQSHPSEEGKGGNSFMDPNHSLQFAASGFSFSRSSKFCTSLYLSTGSESCRQLSNLPPFLPHPPKPELDNFLSFPVDASDGSFNGDNGGFSINDQLELQILSEQLGIDITDDGESPLLDVSIVYRLVLLFNIVFLLILLTWICEFVWLFCVLGNLWHACTSGFTFTWCCSISHFFFSKIN